MKIAVISDIHFDYYNHITVSQQFDILRFVFDYCIKNNINYIVHCGDLFEKDKNIDVMLYNDVLNFFHKELPKELTFYTISGNHDFAKRNTAIDWVAYNPKISSNYGITLNPNVFTLDYKLANLKDYVILYGLPYIKDIKIFKQAIKEIIDLIKNDNNNRKHLLFIHNTPKYSKNEMIEYDFKADDKIFRLFDYVFCGHIHLYKNLANNFSLVGNPFQYRSNEKGKKGFLIYDIPNNNIDFIKVKSPKIKKKKVKKIKVLDKVKKIDYRQNFKDSFNQFVEKESLSKDLIKKGRAFI